LQVSWYCSTFYCSRCLLTTCVPFSVNNISFRSSMEFQEHFVYWQEPLPNSNDTFYLNLAVPFLPSIYFCRMFSMATPETTIKRGTLRRPCHFDMLHCSHLSLQCYSLSPLPLPRSSSSGVAGPPGYLREHCGP
jgi:hypothetical protein